MFRSVVYLMMALVGGNVFADADWVPLRGGAFLSALNYEDVDRIQVAPFALQVRPVTNAEFFAFVSTHPQWRRNKVPSVFAELRYLSHWAGPLELGAQADPQQPVVQVSWFAAAAYCEAHHARLPTWTEWEFAAASDATRSDARADPRWRERILEWYSKPSNKPLSHVGSTPPNVYGVQDMHGLVWEWTEDFSALLVDSDNRSQGDPDQAQFCGAGSLATRDRDNYAVLMRIAMLSSLDAEDTTANLGFRCAKDLK